MVVDIIYVVVYFSYLYWTNVSLDFIYIYLLRNGATSVKSSSGCGGT